MKRAEAEILLGKILADVRRVELAGGVASQFRCCPEFFDSISEAMAATGRSEIGFSPEGSSRLFLTFGDKHQRIIVREDQRIDPAIGAYILGTAAPEGLDNG